MRRKTISTALLLPKSSFLDPLRDTFHDWHQDSLNDRIVSFSEESAFRPLVRKPDRSALNVPHSFGSSRNDDPPGKTMMQLVDADTSLSVDVFWADGEIMSRAISVDFRLGRFGSSHSKTYQPTKRGFCSTFTQACPVAAKHADDYQRLVGLVKSSDMATAWQDHSAFRLRAGFKGPLGTHGVSFAGLDIP